VKLTDIDKLIAKLEAGIPTPGTVISRVLADAEMLREDHGLKVPKELRGSVMAWSVMITQMPFRGREFYGLTLSEALGAALKWKAT